MKTCTHPVVLKGELLQEIRRTAKVTGLSVADCIRQGAKLGLKRGEIPWADVDAWRRELHRDFERALVETKLPERPDYEAANGFLIRTRRLTSQLRSVDSIGNLS